MNKKLNTWEERAFDDAVQAIEQNAHEHCRQRPAMSTLVEEFAEAVLAARGKHDHELALEITQLGGICINILWQLSQDQHDHVCNI